MNTLKHVDDDGDLSIFAAESHVLIACNKGHYWRLPASIQMVSQGEPTRGGKMDGGEAISALQKQFGQAALVALGMAEDES